MTRCSCRTARRGNIASMFYQTLTELSQEELVNIQDRVSRSFSNEGITFAVYGDEEAEERTIPVDCVPRLISNSDWMTLEAGLTQRVRALNLFLEDVYGKARIVRDGVIPVEMVRDCPQYRIEMRGFSPPHGTWVGICGTDLVRTNDGFVVLEDNLRVPSGVSYMLANRKVAKASLRLLYRSSRVRGGVRLRAHAPGDAAGTCAEGPFRPEHRAVDAGGLQLRLLRAHIPGPRTGSGTGGRQGPPGQRRVRIHAHHPAA